MMEDKQYASWVGSLMYAQVCTRPDVAFTISVLGRFQSSAGEAYQNAAKRVMRYLQRTEDHTLVYRKTQDQRSYVSLHKDIKHRLEGYDDLDFAGCPDDTKSTWGCVILMACGAVSWKSVK